jgi:hypothetical protein
MFAFSIVKDLDVLEYRLQGVLRAVETLVVDQLRFDDAEKGFGHGIVPQGQASRSQQSPFRLMLWMKPCLFNTFRKSLQAY